MFKKDFYRQCYNQTGWIPMQPLTRSIELGDVCQINHGYFQPLINMVQDNLIDDIIHSPSIPLNPIDWRINNGVQQTFCSIEKMSKQHEVERVGDISDKCQLKDVYRTKQILSFNHAGDFIFHGADPSCYQILNWNKIKQTAIVLLTQSHYNFRDIYVVTGVASIARWGLAIAGNSQAQLTMAAETESTDLYNLISHVTALTEECCNISTYEKSQNQPAYFFKAKKIVISDEMHDYYLCRLLENNNDLSERSIANWLNDNLLNLIRSNEFNIATSITYFDWVDANLDDVENLLV